jgi:RNA polymerase sigma-70 factor (ECF subfamily)
VPSAREALYWIYRVATNYCLNELRSRRDRAQSHADLADLPETTHGIDAAEARLADQDLVRRLIARARPNVRLVAWLYHLDGFEQEEVAAIVGVSRRTVATRLAEFSNNARKFVRRSAA